MLNIDVKEVLRQTAPHKEVDEGEAAAISIALGGGGGGEGSTN